MDEHDDTYGQTSTRRELLLMHRAGRAFAVYGEEADAVAEGRRPAPLPHAPAAVLGVVPLRGRMRTVIDPAALGDARAEEEDDAAPRTPETPAFIVALRGDEQLALACERVERVAAPPEAEAAGDAAPQDDAAPPDSPHVRAAFLLGPLHVTLLSPAHIFEAAMHGADRRRHRLKNRES
jgi:chemotaxis signal transduction protein